MLPSSSALKRANEKDDSSEFEVKKSKFDHPQNTFILPTRVAPAKREKIKPLADLLPPPVDIEPIVLSSDDEEEINMHKSALAISLNVLPPPMPSKKGKERAQGSTKLSPVTSKEPATSFASDNILEKETSMTTTLKPETNTTSSVTKPSAPKAVITPITPALPGTVTMSISTPTPVQPLTQIPTDPSIATNKVTETTEKPVYKPDFTFLDSSDEEEEVAEKETKKEVEKELVDVEINDGQTSDMEITPASPDIDVEHLTTFSSIDVDQSTTSSNLDVEQLSEEEELQSDSDIEYITESVANKNETEAEPAKAVETTEVAHKSVSRPVRENRNRVITYNDITNSIDTDNITSEDVEKYIIKQKKRSTAPKALSAANVLNTFTRDLKSKRHLKTGFVYDTAMSYHATPNPMEIHPEDPRRIFKIFNILDNHGLLQECKRINSRRATKQEILLVHNIVHYRKMRETAGLKSKSDYMAMENDYDSIYLNSNSFESGLYAVGSLIELVEAVIIDQVKNAFAIIRPPGHHAESDMPMGFCLFNNVAIATRDAMRRLGVKKTLIVDWDVHFGNGTQEIFSEDPDVLYISLHRFEDGSFYPSDIKGRAEYTGHGAGVGKTLNIPWPCAGMTDADYLYAFREVIMPIAMEFSPDVVIVSAGFDAAINDPIGKCNVTPAGYGQMTHMLKSIAHGKLVIALEGGYDLNSIAVSALACMNVLLGDAPEPIVSHLKLKQECIDTIKHVKQVQKEYWNCLS